MFMDLTNRATIKDLLKKHGTKANKGLGQHFILSKKALAQMIEAAEIKKNDTIIEIGSGLGTLTQELAKTGAKIIAIEKDPLMIAILKETLKDFENVKVVEEDARKISIFDIDIEYRYFEYKIVANLPYNVATFLIRQWLEPPPSSRLAGLRRARPEMMILMIQKEVAQRICAKPPHLRQGYGGQARMNLLATSVQFYADVKIIDYVPAEAFWPRPKVDSAIIKIIPKKPPSQKTRNAFFAVVKAGFSQPRKQLIGNLTKKFNIPKEQLLSIFKDLNISEKARAENLSLKQWISLTTSLQPLTVK